MKRFYKLVSLSEKTEDGYAIELDGKPIKTPLRTLLHVPTLALARLIQKEWYAQGELIEPESMPITQIITTALDTVHLNREEIERQTLAYIHTDMICYWADQDKSTGKKQAQSWTPWLDWFEKKTGERLQVTTDLVALTQSTQNITYVSHYIENLDLLHFTVFQLLVSITGSLVLSMAFMEKQCDTNTLFALSHVEDLLKSELYSEDFYGTDPTQERQWNATKKDLRAIGEILKSLET